MQLQTSVEVLKSKTPISHKSKLTLIGSCFADNMGQKFIESKFQVLSNPFGTLYNPMSVCQCIDTIVTGVYEEKNLICYNDTWHSFHHHSIFSHADKGKCVEGINSNLQVAKEHLLNSEFLFITLGTSMVYEYRGEVVSNCHKIPEREFRRYRLSVSEVISQFTETLKGLRQLNPKIKIILTVSPVRHAKDGMHENTLNKSILHLAIDELCKIDEVSYFPAYELVLDELRDYRFFAEDMTHPNYLSTGFIWEKIQDCFFHESTIQLMKRVGKVITAYNHRPFNINPTQHNAFLDTMFRKASDLQKQHPELDLSRELAYFSKKE